MSYCRFSNGDVYMYPSTNGGIECCACRLADKVPTVFTPGVIDETDFRWDLLVAGGDLVCTKCEEGCDACMMHGSVTFYNYQDAIDHLHAHRAAADEVPDYAFEYLKEDMEANEPLEPLLCDCGKVICVFDFESGKQSCLECVDNGEGNEFAELSQKLNKFFMTVMEESGLIKFMDWLEMRLQRFLRK